MKKSDVIGLVYDGRWKVVGFHKYNGCHSNGSFTLENIYNHQTMNLSDKSMKLVVDGVKTVNDFRKTAMRRKTSHDNFIRRQKNRILYYGSSLKKGGQ